jgi:nucleotide-binding universal stress UspA family protein
MSYKKVVVAVSFDADSVKTLGKLQQLGLGAGSEVHLVHAIEVTPALSELIKGFNPSSHYAEMVKAAEVKLQQVQAQLNLKEAKVTVKALVGGNRRQEFLSYVDTQKPNLVVAASQERDGIKGFFEGSFTNFLSKFCQADVLILRP